MGRDSHSARTDPPPEPDLSSLRAAETWIFDLDNTLYPASSNLFSQVDARIQGFVADCLDLDQVEARRVQKQYFREFGTTLNGLMRRHDVDPAAYLAYVHDIDVTGLAPSPALAAVLGRLGARKLVFTNGSTAHAERVMGRLGVDHHFEAIFDIAAADYRPKPEPAVYDELLERFSIDPTRAVMVEDMARNLVPAAALGMTTVWMRGESQWAADGAEGAHVHHVAEDLVACLEMVTRDDPGCSPKRRGGRGAP